MMPLTCPTSQFATTPRAAHDSAVWVEPKLIAIVAVDIKEKSGTKNAYVIINTLAGLVASAQLGVLELHAWGTRSDRIERPERIVFDLDPDESLDLDNVKAAAREIREVLQAGSSLPAANPLPAHQLTCYTIIPPKNNY